MMRELKDLVGKEAITQDAYVLGEVQDIRYDGFTWDAVGIKIKTGKGAAEALNIGSGKSMILVGPGRYIVNQVILMDDTVAGIRSKISVDSDGVPSALYLIGKRVYSADRIVIGVVDSVDVDIEKWHMVSLVIRVDKGAYSPLGIRRGLFGKKKISGILTSNIVSVNESISLDITTEAVKGQMVVL
ncbi:MAG: hypothetical protein MJY54_03235 [archaeon]|nr:hypothetical protein [archaeon]